MKNYCSERKIIASFYQNLTYCQERDTIVCSIQVTIIWVQSQLASIKIYKLVYLKYPRHGEMGMSHPFLKSEGGAVLEITDLSV